MFWCTIWRLEKATKADTQREVGVLTSGAPTAQSSLSPTISELNRASLNTLMYAIRNDEKSEKKLNLVVIHFAILLFFGKLLLKCF